MGNMITIVEFSNGQHGFQYGWKTDELDKSELTIKKKIYVPDTIIKEIESCTLKRMNEILVNL